jgi:hypothetical protein
MSDPGDQACRKAQHHHQGMDRLQDVTDEEIAGALAQYHIRRQDVSLRWASDACRRLIWWNPERAWPIILSLIRQVPNDLLELIGAGELEVFVRRHATDYIAQIEERARSDPRFLAALSEVWLPRGAVSKTVQKRLVRASRGRIKVLGWVDA